MFVSSGPVLMADVGDVVGACRYERTEARTTERNGVRPRLVATQAGDVPLRIPKLRKGSFYPSILEPRRRIDQALYAVVMEAYVHGVSTRSVDDLVAALGIDSGISKSEVSRICEGGAKLSARSGPARSTTPRSLTSTSTRPTCTYAGSSSQVTSMAVVVAPGITAECAREVRPRKWVVPPGLDVGTVRTRCSGVASRFAEESRSVRCSTGHQ